MSSNERYRSAEQVLARSIQDMGHELGRVYNALSTDLSRLHVKWDLYRRAYARSSERIDVLNRTAGWFFRVVQGALIGDVLMHIGRMTDKERIGKRHNLTIQRLPALVPEGLRAEVAALNEEAIAVCDRMRPWRDRRGAHTDLETAILGSAVPDVTLEDIDAALASLRALLNCVERHYWREPTMYERIVTPPGDAESLVYYLVKGIRSEEAREQRL